MGVGHLDHDELFLSFSDLLNEQTRNSHDGLILTLEVSGKEVFLLIIYVTNWKPYKFSDSSVC
jgi:hypothetical protein